MTQTISGPSGSVTVHHLDGFRSSRPSATRAHTVIGRQDPDVTVGPLGLSKGRIDVWCATLTDAVALETLHEGGGPFTLTMDDPGLSITYEVDGDGGDVERLVASSETATPRWVVSIPFVEVAT